MKQFELYYPVKPLHVNQNFGENATSYYKDVLKLNGHNGIDFQAFHGQTVRASHDGIVTFSGEDGSGGLGVVIRTEEKFEYLGNEVYFKSIYWHLMEGSIVAKAGQRVKVGDILGKADNTGLSTGDHLHFGVKPVLQGEQDWEWYNVEQKNGYNGAIDPNPYFNRYFAEDKTIVLSIYKRIIETLKTAITKNTPKN